MKKLTMLLLTMAAVYTASASDKFAGVYIGDEVGYTPTSSLLAGQFGDLKKKPLTDYLLTNNITVGYAYSLNNEYVAFSEIGALSALSNPIIKNLPNHTHIEGHSIFGFNATAGIGYHVSEDSLLYATTSFLSVRGKLTVSTNHNNTQSRASKDFHADNFAFGLGARYALHDRFYIGAEGKVILDGTPSYQFLLSLGTYLWKNPN